MSKKTLSFNIEANKKEFHVSKQPTALDLVLIDKIVLSDKFGSSDNGFKCFIGYKDDNVIRSLCIILPQMSGYIKYFDNEEKSMFL